MKSLIKIAILGEKGIIGAWLKDLFKSRGHTILASDQETQSKNPQIVKEADIILIAVPLLETSKVINQIKDNLTEDKLVVEFTSSKTKFIEELLATKAKVLSLHPMFAPYVNKEETNFNFHNKFAGERLIFSNVRNHQIFSKDILQIFIDEGLQLIESEVAEHDKVMSIVQGITHFLSLALLMTMKKSKIDSSKSFDFASPIYKMRLGSAARIVMQNADLYHGIFTQNSFLPEVLDKLEDSIKELRKIVSDDDCNKMKGLFFELKELLGETGVKSFDETEKMIEFLRSSKE